MTSVREAATSPRPSVRRAWTVLGALMLITSVPSTVLSGYERLSRSTEISTLTFAANRFAAGPSVLDISTNGDITVIGTDDAGVTVLRRTVQTLQRARSSATVTGSTLRLRGSCATFVAFCSVSYTVRVPRDVRVVARSNGADLDVTATSGAVDAKSSGGSLRVERTSGALTVSSSGGDVVLKDVVGSINASSSGGSVRGSLLQSTSVNASSSGGNIDLAFTVAPDEVTLSSSGGDIDASLPPGEQSYRADASASGGGTHVDIRTDPSSMRSIVAHSSGGSVRIDYGD